MVKRSQQSRDKRRSERDLQNRWGAQQKALHTRQLSRDLRYYEERGLLVSDAASSEIVSQALWDSQNWRGEPEFRDLTFDPYVSGQALNQAWQEAEIDPAAYAELSDEDKDVQEFQCSVQAIESVLTPEIKKDVLRRFERFRQRLRAAQQPELLAQASLTQMFLEGSDEVDEAIWPECMLIFQLHQEAVDEYIRLHDAAEAALDHALRAVGRDDRTFDEPLTDDERLQVEAALAQAARESPGLIEFLTSTTDEVIDQALNAVWHGQLMFNLFTTEETTQFYVYFAAALKVAGAGQMMPEDLPPKGRAEVDQYINESVLEFLNDVDTPQRRAELYGAARAAVSRLAGQEDPGAMSSDASLLLSLLKEEIPLAENEFFFAALMGEFGRRIELEDADDEDELGDEPFREDV